MIKFIKFTDKMYITINYKIFIYDKNNCYNFNVMNDLTSYAEGLGK